MPNNKKPAQKPTELDLVKQLADVMKEHDLSEVSLTTEFGRVRIRRGGFASHAPVAAHSHATHASSKAEARPEPAKTAKPLLEIKSESIGTFYSRANPEAEPYVKIGSQVKPNSPVGQIEAMKMFSEITAGVTGTIAEILVEDKQAVEYGTVLFKVDPS